MFLIGPYLADLIWLNYPDFTLKEIASRSQGTHRILMGVSNNFEVCCISRFMVYSCILNVFVNLTFIHVY